MVSLDTKIIWPAASSMTTSSSSIILLAWLHILLVEFILTVASNTMIVFFISTVVPTVMRILRVKHIFVFDERFGL